jgi:hypothetical protein
MRFARFGKAALTRVEIWRNAETMSNHFMIDLLRVGGLGLILYSAVRITSDGG